MKTKRILATILTFAMLITLLPVTVSVSAAEPVVNDGIFFNKTAQVNGDGTVDIIMEAYTTGTVTNTTDSVPADIVLVLDMSGSMDDEATNAGVKEAVLGADISSLFTTRYGFSDTSGPYYIKNASDEYVEVTYVGYDDSGAFGVGIGHQYYTDGVNNYYPKLAISASGRTQAYEEKQFYTEVYPSHMEVLKEGASAFIADVAAKNATITDPAKKHRISIVKFATASYYNGTTGVTDHTQAVVGDNRQSNGYNYTQVVKNLTIVDDVGEADLITALNSLVAGGATAVDYGIQLAEDVLGSRPADEIVGRSEAIIVFTDGSPTHGSGYSASVAGSAINEALALKNAGVKIFSIGGANDANSNVLGNDSNAFMHYISNNYPNASYANGTITPGEGSITNGYYMTPSDDKNLEEIFLDIFNQTANSDIIMGTSAGVIDTISPYFTIPGVDASAKVANVTVKTAKKTASGWDAPETLVGATVDVNGNTLTVRGFDFDENYVSETPRQVDGSDFYGKKLIITVKVTPDYDEIDIHSANFAGGAIPTNEGLASVVNSANEPVITAESPTVTAKKVIYKVDGQDYEYFYRLPGATVDVISDVPTKEGHTFNGWDRTGSFTMPDDDVVINGSFSVNNYNVTYVFSGVVPDLPTGTTEADYLPNGGASYSVPFGTTYTIEDVIDPTEPGSPFAGYHFVGWTPRQENLQVNYDDSTGEYSFSMPASNVTLIGYFTASESTPYKIEHYTETFTDGEFELKETENKFGETDKEVTATPKTYTGFTFDSSVTGTVITDTIEGDGMTTLKLYYTRNEYDVVYEFDGTVPSGVTAPGRVTKKYGESYTIEDTMNVPGYDFIGWYYTSDLTYSNVSGNTITVDRDIYLAGEFTAKSDTTYIVEHWIQNADDDNYTLDTHLTETLSGTTDTDATAYARILEGLTFNETKTNDELAPGQSLDTTGTIASVTANIDRNGNTVIKFYYDRLTYKVTYRFEGTVPSDAPDISGLSQTDVRHGATVTADTTIPNLAAWPTGYTGFYGWYRGAAIDANLVTEFTMPARDVELLGYFIPADDTAYIVRHFLQNADDDNYTEDTSRQETLHGTTNESIEAYPLTTIIGLGYKPNKTETQNHLLADQQLHTKADGSVEKITTTLSASGTEISFYYDRNTYNVTYQYINAPAGAPAVPTDSTDYRHGANVSFDTTVPSVAGYTFHGWHIQDSDITTTADGFTMPNRDVVIYGTWTANSNTGYKVEHYYENLDGTYGDGDGLITPKYTETQHTGTTGHTAVAAEIPVAGFTLDTSHTDTVASAVIEGDGNTTLKLYYKRNVYKVTYEYSGAMPSAAFKTAADAQLPNGGVAYELKHGATHQIQPVVNIAADVALAGYSFHGWTPNDTALVITANEFTMPMHDIILVGHFHPNADTPYTINHYLELEAGGYPTVPNHTEKRPGETGSEATVYARKFDGYVIDLDTTVNETVTGDYTTLTDVVAGDGSTAFNFYYKRIEYAVTYEFDGIQPHGITATLPAAGTAKYGTTVNVEPDLNQDGYTFTGWYSTDPAIDEDDATFTMPNMAVVLKGKFTANADTAYKVQYHLQKLNAAETDVAGTNKATDYEKVETVNLTGTTGHTATAEIKHYDGFIARTDNTITAVVTGDGQTVIDIYYDRVTNPIAYHFYGAFPDHTDAELPAKEENVPFGAKRTVAPEITCDPSHRHVPTNWASPHVVADDVTREFTMPATKVDFYTAVRHIYKVEYDLNGGTGATGVDYTTVDVFAGTVVDVKTAPTKTRYSFTGWKLDGTDTVYNPDDEITVNEDIKLIAQYTYNGGGNTPGGGGSAKKYTLIYESNGGTEYNNEKYSPNTVVKIDKKPVKEDYVFEGWYEDKELTKYVDEVKMTQNITVYAKWVVDNGSAGNGHKTPSSLNGTDHFAYVVGYPDGTVRPDYNISRAEVTTIFFRLLTSKLRASNLSDKNVFADIDDEDWHNIAISTMTKLGIVKGRYTDKFVPDADITRAEFATICARFDDSEFEITDNFTDVAGHWAESDIHEAAAHGWIRGYEDGTFKPDQPITRAEAMTMINRVLNRVPETVADLLPGMRIWSDNSDTTAWYYLPIQEATNSHDFGMKNHIYERWTALKEGTDWIQYQ